MVQLHRARDDFEKAGFEVVLVGLGNRDESEKFRKEFAPYYKIICDPEKDLFRAYGLSRGTIAGMVSPGIFIKGLRTLSQGYMPGIPRGDVFQLAGVFMIDTRGNVRYSRYSRNIADYPPVEALLNLKALV